MSIREFAKTREGKLTIAVIISCFTNAYLLADDLAARGNISNVEKALNKSDKATKMHFINEGVEGDISYKITNANTKDEVAIKSALKSYNSLKDEIKAVPSLEKGYGANVNIESYKLDKGLESKIMDLFK